MNLSKRNNWWSRSYKRGEWICPKELTDEVDAYKRGGMNLSKRINWWSRSYKHGEWICPK